MLACVGANCERVYLAHRAAIVSGGQESGTVVSPNCPLYPNPITLFCGGGVQVCVCVYICLDFHLSGGQVFGYPAICISLLYHPLFGGVAMVMLQY